MKVEVHFFGHLKELIGQDFILIEDIHSTNDLLQQLNELYPSLKEKTFIVAVNNKIVNQNSNLFNENIIAIMPPFSGG